MGKTGRLNPRRGPERPARRLRRHHSQRHTLLHHDMGDSDEWRDHFSSEEIEKVAGVQRSAADTRREVTANATSDSRVGALSGQSATISVLNARARASLYNRMPAPWRAQLHPPFFLDVPGVGRATVDVAHERRRGGPWGCRGGV